MYAINHDNDDYNTMMMTMMMMTNKMKN